MASKLGRGRKARHPFQTVTVRHLPLAKTGPFQHNQPHAPHPFHRRVRWTPIPGLAEPAGGSYRTGCPGTRLFRPLRLSSPHPRFRQDGCRRACPGPGFSCGRAGYPPHSGGQMAHRPQHPPSPYHPGHARGIRSPRLPCQVQRRRKNLPLLHLPRAHPQPV